MTSTGPTATGPSSAEPTTATPRDIHGPLIVVLPIILAFLSMLGPFSVDTPFPGFAHMRTEFGVGPAEMQWVVSAYLASFAIMSIFHGPLSDALGRKPVMLTGVLVYAAASVGCALSTSLGMLLVFRVIQGLSAGGGVIVSRTIIRDLYEGEQAQRLMSRVAMIFGLGPAIAPIIGGLLLQFGPWRTIFWFLVVYGVLMALAIIFLLPETHPVERRVPFRLGPMMASLGEVARSPRFHRVAWSSALSFGGQFLYIGAAAIFVVDLLHKGETDFWVFFAPMISGVVLGSAVSSRAAGRVSGRTLVTAGFTFALFAAGLNIAIAASPLGDQLPWAVIGPSLVAFGISCGWPTQQLTMLDMFPGARGAAASLGSFFALMLNALAAVFLVPYVTGSVLQLALASGALVLLGMICWVWHLSMSKRDLHVPEHSEILEPTDKM